MRAYLPLIMRQLCKPAVSNRNFVILVLDASSSMEEASGAQTKITAAKAAALSFVDLLRPGSDVVGVVPFNSQAAPFGQGSVWPAEDFTAARAAITGIRTSRGTRIEDVYKRQMQMEPGPTPTLIASAPASTRRAAPSPVATLPTTCLLYTSRCV